LGREPGYALYNLSMTNLGLDGAIRVIAECVEKRVDLGDFEETAWDVALDMFEFFLENPERADAKSVMDYGVSPSDFAIWMAQTAMPLIERPTSEGTKITINTDACQTWRDGFIFPDLEC
jgi:hypothetical protein